MDRREFVLRTIGGGVAALTLGNVDRLMAKSADAGAQSCELAAVMGGQPGAMFDKAIEVFGGMSSFVRKGQRVLVKPNIGWDVEPDRAGNTNPELIRRIVEHCINAGAKEVTVFDHTCDNWNRCYKTSGIERAVADAGGKTVSGASEGLYQEVQVPNGKRLKKAKVHELLLQADVFINVPILKHHSSSRLTIGMKNLMGVVWDRGYWHENDLHQCIADFASYRKADLTVVDAYNVLKRNGPRGVSKSDVLAMKSQIVSRDPVAADAAAAKLFGSEPADIPYITMAADLGLGKKDLGSVAIKKLKM